MKREVEGRVRCSWEEVFWLGGGGVFFVCRRWCSFLLDGGEVFFVGDEIFFGEEEVFLFFFGG